MVLPDQVQSDPAKYGLSLSAGVSFSELPMYVAIRTMGDSRRDRFQTAASGKDLAR